VADDFESFTTAYLQDFVRAVETLDRAALRQITEVLSAAQTRGANVFVAGNGGSAAIANHFECDASKGTFVPGTPPLRSHSLSANPSMITAFANDVGYEEVFASQIDLYGRPGDVAFIISSSGNSPSVVVACQRAKERGLITCALVGFAGGDLKKLADHVLHIPVHNYGIVEDMHQAVIHLVTQYMKRSALKSVR
jgi:phosphoheptose isomerase